jgi:hypothetical protein
MLATIPPKDRPEQSRKYVKNALSTVSDGDGPGMWSWDSASQHVRAIALQSLRSLLERNELSYSSRGGYAARHGNASPISASTWKLQRDIEEEARKRWAVTPETAKDYSVIVLKALNAELAKAALSELKKWDTNSQLGSED